MKVIDLLNKIAKGEEVPKKIKVFGYEWLYEPLKTSNIPYYSVLGGYNIVDYFKLRSLNDEVEIIEEEKDIEELTFRRKIDKYTETLDYGALEDKINELVKEVNKLKNKGD